jgi:hypothetical protein
VESRKIGLDAVKDLAGEAPERQLFGERHEVGVGVDLLFLQVGRADLRTLAYQLKVIGRPAVCTENLNTGEVVMKSTQDGA